MNLWLKSYLNLTYNWFLGSRSARWGSPECKILAIDQMSQIKLNDIKHQEICRKFLNIDSIPFFSTYLISPKSPCDEPEKKNYIHANP